MACKRIVEEGLHLDNDERNSPGFLSLICELAVLPETYDIILSALSEVPENVPDNNPSDSSEENEFLAPHSERKAAGEFLCSIPLYNLATSTAFA